MWTRKTLIGKRRQEKEKGGVTSGRISSMTYMISLLRYNLSGKTKKVRYLQTDLNLHSQDFKLIFDSQQPKKATKIYCKVPQKN